MEISPKYFRNSLEPAALLFKTVILRWCEIGEKQLKTENIY